MKTIRVWRPIRSAIDIACPPARLWDAIIEDVFEAQYYARRGYRIEPIAEAATHPAAYRVRLYEPELVDDVIGLMTERDDDGMRLSVYGKFLMPAANGFVAYATYQAFPTATGSHYRLDGHVAFDHAHEEDATPQEIADGIEAACIVLKQGNDADFVELKARLEAA